MRLIDADKLSAEMYHEAFVKDSDMQKWDSGCWIRYKMFENVLKAQPTVEAPDINVGNIDTTTHDSIPAETGKNDGDRTIGDCISRQRSVDALRKMQTYKLFAGDDMLLINQAEAQTELMMLPSVQPERPRGHWVEIGDEPYDEWECDVCGFAIDGSGCIDPEEYRDVYKFCPNCGADMRGDKHETD